MSIITKSSKHIIPYLKNEHTNKEIILLFIIYDIRLILFDILHNMKVFFISTMDILSCVRVRQTQSYSADTLEQDFTITSDHKPFASYFKMSFPLFKNRRSLESADCILYDVL